MSLPQEWKYIYMPVSCFLYFGKKKVTSKQEKLIWIESASSLFMVERPPLLDPHQQAKMVLAGAMSNVPDAGSLHISLLF